MKNIIYLSLVLLLFGCSSLKNNSIDKIENLGNNKKKYLHDSCTNFSYITQNEEEKYGKLFYEYIDLNRSCKWNGMQRGFFVDLFKSTLKLQNMKVVERVDYSNYEFTTYLIDDKYYLNFVYKYSIYEDLFIVDYDGKFFDEKIKEFDKNYENKFLSKPRFISNYSNSLVKMNILNSYFTKDGSDFEN
jgi:hypothetical protein